MKTVLLFGWAALALAGCSDPKDATKDNFKVAIDNWIKKTPACVGVPTSPVTPAARAEWNGFPKFVDASSTKSSMQQESRQRQAAPFDALVGAGLLSASNTEIGVDSGMFGGRLRQLPVKAYVLTDAGKAAVVTKGEKTQYSEPSYAFCYGTPTVDEVVQFTEPGDIIGIRASQVAYRYHLADVPAWARANAMKAAFPEIKRDLEPTIERKAAVILTNDGWVHEKAM